MSQNQRLQLLTVPQCFVEVVRISCTVEQTEDDYDALLDCEVDRVWKSEQQIPVEMPMNLRIHT
ncbi:MAG: hypothetical protein ACYSUD_17550 [Planctomycetota bacterium]